MYFHYKKKQFFLKLKFPAGYCKSLMKLAENFLDKKTSIITFFFIQISFSLGENMKHA